MSAVSYEDNTTSGYHLEHPVHQSGERILTIFKKLKCVGRWGCLKLQWIYCHHLELSKATSRIKVCLQAYPAKMYYTGHLAKPQFALHLLLDGGIQKQSSEGRTFIFIVSLKHIADSYWGCSFIPWQRPAS